MKSSLWTTLLGAALTLTCAVSNAANPAYRLTLIGPDPVTEPFQSTYIFDINDKGDLVGSLSGSIAPRAFLWRNGTMTDLGDLGHPAGYSYLNPGVDPGVPFVQRGTQTRADRGLRVAVG